MLRGFADTVADNGGISGKQDFYAFAWGFQFFFSAEVGWRNIWNFDCNFQCFGGRFRTFNRQRRLQVPGNRRQMSQLLLQTIEEGIKAHN